MAKKYDKDRIYYLSPYNLIEAPWNPSSIRTDPKNKAFSLFAKDIWQNGQIMPIAVTKDLIIVEGHRRNAACKMYGLKVKVFFVTDEEAQHIAQTYVRANEHIAKHNSAEKLKEYLINEESVSKDFARKARNIEAKIGRPRLEKFGEMNVGLGTLVESMNIYYWLIDDYIDEIEPFDVMWWAANYRQISRVINLKRLGKITAEKVFKAIKGNKKLKKQ